jgi:hypothetical protein
VPWLLMHGYMHLPWLLWLAHLIMINQTMFSPELPLQRSFIDMMMTISYQKLITWKRRCVASEWDRCCSEGPKVTWYLCWLILSTTGHHLDPTIVKNMSTGVCQDSSSSLIFVCFRMQCFCCSPWLWSFVLVWFALLVWGNIIKWVMVMISSKAKGLAP